MTPIDHTVFTGISYQPYLDFWKRNTENCLNGFQFTLDKNPIKNQKNQPDFETISFEMETELSNKIQSMVNGNELGIYTILLAGLSVLFQKYANNKHIIFKSPVLPGGTKKVVTNVPIIIPVEESNTWKQHLVQVQGIVKDSYRYQHFPLELVSDKIENNKIYASNIAVSFLGLHTQNNDTSGLNITFKKTGSGIEAEFKFDKNLFYQDFMANIWEHFSNLLLNINQLDNTLVKSTLFSEKQQNYFLEGLNTGNIITTAQYNKTIIEVFEESVVNHGESIALTYNEKEWTYNEVNEMANQLAHCLREEYQVKPDDMVGIMLPRSEWMIVGMLGILKAGGAFLPIDAAYPTERKAYILQDADVKLLLTHSDEMFELSYYSGALFAMDIQLQGLTTPKTNPQLVNKPTDLAYIIYTSGSTGKPKGVMLEHRGKVNMTLDQVKRFGIVKEDNVLQFASFSFDASVYEIFMALYAGANLVLIDKEVIGNVQTFEKFVQGHSITVVTLPPAFLRTLNKENLSTIRVMVTAGEAANSNDALECSRFASYYNAYGPTECSVCVTVRQVKPSDAFTETVPIGTSISNMKSYVLDEAQNLVPKGMVGELCVSGVGLARGYVKRPDLTEKYFKYHEDIGERLYHTGDLVRLNPDNELEYVGRKDDQFKLRGYRVEPEEIARNLTTHPGIEEAVVIKTEGDSLAAIAVPDKTNAKPLQYFFQHKKTAKFSTLPNGLVALYKNKFEIDVLYDEIFVDQIYHRSGVTINDGDTIFDVGANIGLFSLYAGLHYNNVKVFAFEPVPEVFEIMHANTQMYNINVEAFDYGLSDKEQKISFTYYPNNTALSSRYGDSEKDKQTVRQAFLNRSEEIEATFSDEALDNLVQERVVPKQIECNMRRISDVIKEKGIEKIDLLKIDVERSEWEVLQGIDEDDWHKVKQIAVEVHDENGALERIENTLQEKGFTILKDQISELEQTDLYNLYAYKPELAGTPKPQKEIEINTQNGIWTDSKELINDLKGFASAKLPEYMVPALINLVPAIPLTNNGKIDKKALKEISSATRQENKNYKAPETETQEKLAALWETILDKERIGIDEDFFELGGHSLKATLLISQIYKEIQVEIDLGSVFLNPTIEKLAKVIDESQKSTYSSIPKAAEQEYYDLSFAQRRLWILNQFPESRKAYLMPNVHLLKDIDVAGFKAAINKLVARHESLRTNFISVEGEPKQKIHQAEAFGFKIEEINLIEEKDQSSVVNALIAQESEIEFDLSKDPLLRAKLVQLQDNVFLFLLTMHHIITDGWSVNILIKELFELYQAGLKSESNSLPELPIQYKDYAVWQQEQLKQGALEEAASYWAQKFTEVPVINLPTDFPRPAVKNFRGNYISIPLNQQLSEAFKAWCNANELSILMGLTAVVNALLYQYTGQSDIVLGTTVSGRNHPDLEGQNGFYVNTLALKTTFDPKASFNKLGENVKETILGAFKYQQYPFDLLLDNLNLVRDTSRSPLFDVLVEVLNVNPYGNGEGNSRENQNPYTAAHITSKYDLSFKLGSFDEGFTIYIEYNTDLYVVAHIERMLQHFQQLVKSVVTNSGLPLAELEYIPAKENEIIHQFSQGNKKDTLSKTIIELFDEQAVKTPSEKAIVFKETHWTYKELSDEVNKIALELIQTESFAQHKTIGIMVERSNSMVAAILAILRAGGTFVCIDPEYPDHRKQYILEDATIELLIIDSGQMLEISSIYNKAIYVLDINMSEESNNEASLPAYPSVNNLAYQLYTSGSTGKPKGVKITHKSIANYMVWANQYYFNNEKEYNLPLFTSMSFDLTLTSLFSPLLRGGTLVICEEKPIDKLLQQIFDADSLVNTVKLTPSHIDLLKAMNLASTHISKIILGGEALKPHQIEALQKLNPEIEIYNEYGPTETTVGSAVNKITNAHEITIGAPIANTAIYILDDAGKPLPIGVPGELIIGGAGVAAGYCNQEALTAAKFIVNPITQEPDDLVYKTGDIGKWTPEGTIILLGRKDHQVKIRGFRIELEEIETAIIQHENIQNAAVIAIDNEDEQALIAYIESENKDISLTALRTYLSKLLPDYMIPAEFRYTDKIPLTNNGKVDREKLKQVDLGERLSQQEYVAPTNPIEAKLAEIWENVLDKEKIGITDDFFSLGGHSLKATQIVMRTYQELNCEIDISSLFTSPTIAELAHVIAEKDTSVYKEIQPVDGKENYVLSPAQKRLWITEQLTPGQSVYNSYGSYIIEGKLDEAVLQRVFQTLVERHEVLRTIFEVVDGEPRQKIRMYNPENFKIQKIDISEEQEKETLVANYAKKAATDTFDLTKDPLIRMLLLQTEAEKFVFYFTLHHIISDGWSMNILISEFSVLYEAFSQGKPNPLQPLRIHYKDYATWLHAQLSNEKHQEHRAWWHNQFKGEVPVLALPLENPRPVEKTYNGSVHTLWFSKELRNELAALGAGQGASLFMVLLGTFKTLLYRYTQQKDIVIGTVETGRNHPDLASQIGIYVNTLALRTQLEETETFQQLLGRIKEIVLGAYQHAMYPFDQLLEDLQVTWEKNHSPLFDIAFSLENVSSSANEEESELGVLNAKGNNDKVWSNIFDLVINAKESSEGIMVNFHYNTDLFSERYITLFATHFQQMARAIVANSQGKLSELAYLSEAEIQDLSQYNKTGTPYPETALMHGLFEQSVKNNPNQTGVIYNKKRLKYSKLNKLANRMAHYLRKETKVVPNDIVAIMLDKSEQSLIAILGVLKSGAAYLPIDPDYPQERINFMLKEARVKVLITTTDYMMKQKSFDGALFAVDVQMNKLPKEDKNPEFVNDPDDTAYVIFTSGSTGLPKGVMVSHRANINMALDQISRFSITDNDKVLQFASLSFDASVYEIFMGLYAGATLVLADKKVIQSTETFMEYISSQKVSVATLPPAYLKILNIDQLHFIRVLITAGEAANVADALQCSKHMNYFNAYGPTEAAVCVSVYQVGASDQGRHRIPIGKPINNIEMHILDKNGQLVPVGVEGELFIGGVGLAKGYLNRPDLTAERFVQIPEISKNTLYKTGDVCKRLPDGTIDFIGRNDDQVKINGFRIELGEITAVLQDSKWVEDVHVLLEQNGNEKKTIAFVVPTLPEGAPDWNKNAVPGLNNGKPTAGANLADSMQFKDEQALSKELLLQCQDRLPAYMIPNEIIFITEIPLTINGKVAKKQLLKKASEMKAHLQKDRVLPRNKYEEKIANIWKEILHLEYDIDVTKNFFELGGNSLKATQIIAQLNKLEAIKFQVTDVFHYNTVESFAKLMEISEQSISRIKEAQTEDKDYTKTILFFGTSLTAGHGLKATEAFPSLIQHKLDNHGSDYKVINAGLHMETTTQGKNRLKWVLDQKVDVFVLELGANDGSSGVSLTETRNNLQEIIDMVLEKNKNTIIVMAGMQVPASLGETYTNEFQNIFPEMAIANNIPLIPDLLKGVSNVPELNLKDGVHPNAEGQKLLAENVWTVLKEVLLPTQASGQLP